MPRDISGNYTLPVGNPVVSGTIIDVLWANPTMADIAVQLNNVLTRDATLGPTQPIKFVNGTSANPGLTFATQTGTGLYNAASTAGYSFRGATHWESSAALLTFPVVSYFQSNVGVGVSTPLSTLHVKGTFSHQNGVDGTDTMRWLNAAGGLMATMYGAGNSYFTIETNGDIPLILNSNGASGRLRFQIQSNDAVVIDLNRNVGVGTTTPTSRMHIEGSIAYPSPLTLSGTTYTVLTTDHTIRFGTQASTSLTLPAAGSFPGRELRLSNYSANAVVSGSSDVKPMGSNVAGTAILAATAGKWAILQSNGSHWVVTAAN